VQLVVAKAPGLPVGKWQGIAGQKRRGVAEQNRKSVSQGQTNDLAIDETLSSSLKKITVAKNGANCKTPRRSKGQAVKVAACPGSLD
jgi:hypothetical protein